MLWQIRIASPIAEAVSIVGRAFSGHIWDWDCGFAATFRLRHSFCSMNGSFFQ
jgi:hypothetical protein